MTNKQTIDGVSREAIEAILGLRGKGYVNAWKELRALLDKPVTSDFESWWVEAGEQLTKHEVGLKDLMQCAYEAVPAAKPQGEPVAWVHPAYLVRREGWAPMAIDATLNQIAPAQIPLYAQPQGEVERLRAELAERDALLRELLEYAELGWDFIPDISVRVRFALSTSAEPKPRGEAVACLIRSRNILTQASNAVDGKNHFSTWSKWEPGSIEYGRAVTDPLRNDPVCYEMELLFKEQPAPVAPFDPNTVVCRRYTLEQSPGQNFYHYDLKPMYGPVSVTLSELIKLAESAPVAVVLPELDSTFESWWETSGQYCRAGGGSYEKTFAYRAYEAALAETEKLNGLKP